MPFGYYMYFDPLYLTVAVISLVIMTAAQIMVKSRYAKYSKIRNSIGLTGADAARRVLEAGGVYDVRIEKVGGHLSDHFDPRQKVIRLSEEVYNSPSIAAVGIAAHEAGHALQHAEKYFPIKVRTAIIPFAQYGPMVGLILVLIGAAINAFNLTVFGFALFASTFIFQFVTLPVEFNASSRALKAIERGGMLYGEELSGARRVLTAAALTYVAAMLQSFLTLLYYAIRIFGNSSRRR